MLYTLMIAACLAAQGESPVGTYKLEFQPRAEVVTATLVITARDSGYRASITMRQLRAPATSDSVFMVNGRIRVYIPSEVADLTFEFTPSKPNDDRFHVHLDHDDMRGGLKVERVQSPAPPPERPALVPRLRKTLDSLAARGEFSGVVVLEQNGTPVFQQAYGDADRASKRPNRIDTYFNIGSLNKLFTAAAIRQLADAGKLNLDATFDRYLPDYPNQSVARRVTIRQMLNMSSGLGGDIFREPRGGTRHAVRHNREFVPLFVNDTLDFEPGSKRQYSNSGFVVLGMLVERVSKTDYYDYVRQHVYVPSGMTHTGSWLIDSLPANAAIGYTRHIGYDDTTLVAVHPNTDLLPGRGSAAGGGYSTAPDLVNYLSAVRAERVPGNYRGALHIAGGAPGLNAALEGGLPGGYDLVVLSNLDPPTAQSIAQLVRGWLGVAG